jgi:septal ring factor EnvC (AmiA/AmiB activator)
MPNVLSPEIKAAEKKDDDITEKLKSKLSILETELKNKEQVLKGISSEYSQKQVNDGCVIKQLRKNLEEAEKKNTEFMNMISNLENEKRRLENSINEINKMSDTPAERKQKEQTQTVMNQPEQKPTEQKASESENTSTESTG